MTTDIGSDRIGSTAAKRDDTVGAQREVVAAVVSIRRDEGSLSGLARKRYAF